MVALQSVTAANFAPGDRLGFWRDLFLDKLGSVKAEQFEEAEFDGKVSYGSIGELTLCSIKVGPHRVTRAADLIRRTDRGVFKVVFQLSGSCWFEQEGRELVLTPGEWSLYDTSRPYRVANREPSEQLAVLIPRHLLNDASVHATRCAVEAFSTRRGVGRLLRTLVNTTFEELDDIQGNGQQLADSVVEFVQMALFERLQEKTVLSVREVLLERIKLYANRRLHDPDLSIDELASAMNISKRYIHKLFQEDEHDTIGRYLLKRRLERCREDLLKSDLAHRSIITIAFDWGFNDASHFSHVFKKHFGISPKDLRRRGSLADEPAIQQAWTPAQAQSGRGAILRAVG